VSDKIHLRCSALPLAFRCPGSTRAAVPVNEASPAADAGTAAHDGLAGLVRTGRIDWDSVPELAKKHGVDEKEIRALLALGQKVWAQVAASFPNASSEAGLKYELSGVRLTGRADVIAYDAHSGTLRVADFKTGRLDADYAEQLRGYMALGLLTAGAALRAEAGVLWLREGDYEHYSMDRAQLLVWLKRIEDEIVNWDGQFRPGAHCSHCPRSHECGAANALARRDMAVILDKDLPGHLEDADTIRAMRERDPDGLVDLLERARSVKKIAERVEAAAKEEVLRAGDVLGKEKRLTMQDRETRSLDAWAAFPVLQAELDDAEMAEVIDISLHKAEEIVGKKAGKGNAARAKRELTAKLAEAGAIQTGVVRSLVVRRNG